MPFTRTNWMNYSPPAINAANLLNMEDGIWYGLAHSGGVRNTAEFLDRNPASTTGGLAEAVLDLAGAPGVVFAAPHNHPIAANYAVPATVHLIVNRGATFAIANGVTLTINGTIEAGLYQIFSLVGTGRAIVSKYQALYPQWWGAALDGTIDDVTPIQQMFDAVGDTTEIRPGNFIFTGPAAISGTILLERRSGKMTGLGWGSSDATAPAGHYIKWIGPPGIPMLRVHRCWGMEPEGFRFIGDSGAKPSAAISMYNLVADGNPNSYNKFNRIWIGAFYGFDGDDAEQFDVGILFEGDNLNNSENSFDTIRINKCGVGIDITQTQNLNNAFHNLNVWSCPIGLRSVSSLVGSNWYFSLNGIDLDLATGATVITSFTSEQASQMAVMGNDARLLVDGGYWQAFTADVEVNGRVIDSFGNWPGEVILRHFRFDYEGGYAGPDLKIRMKEAPGGVANKFLKMTQVRGVDLSSLDMDSGAAAGNRRYIDVEFLDPYGEHLVTRNILGDGDTVGDLSSQFVRADKDGDGDFDPLTSTDWDGDAFAAGNGTIDWNADFGVPTLAKAVAVYVIVIDETVNAYLGLRAKNTTTNDSLGARVIVANEANDYQGVIPIAANGTSYWRVTNELDNVYMYVVGWFI